MKKTRLVILSGPSGAGKSTAIKVLEDIGYFCVDNLPVMLIPKFMELAEQSGEISKVALVVDVREGEFLKDFSTILAQVKEEGFAARLTFLEATDEALVKRFSATRRRHPLATSSSPLEGIREEREILGSLKKIADEVIDTTDFNVHNLKRVLSEHFSAPLGDGSMALNIISFGYSHGIPSDADIVLDLRFLPNPFFIDELKALNGLDERIKDFILSKDETKLFVERTREFLSYLIPLYSREGKSYLTVALGCTGGKHRSVTVAELLATEMRGERLEPRTRHRDIDRH